MSKFGDHSGIFWGSWSGRPDSLRTYFHRAVLIAPLLLPSRATEYLVDYMMEMLSGSNNMFELFSLSIEACRRSMEMILMHLRLHPPWS